MLDKFKYKTGEIGIPRNIYYHYYIFLFWMAGILNIAKNGGNIQVSGCLHYNSEILWYQGHLSQISCFCPAMKMYGYW